MNFLLMGGFGFRFARRGRSIFLHDISMAYNCILCSDNGHLSSGLQESV